MPITRTVLETAQRHPDRPAIFGTDGRLDYAGLVQDSRRVFAVVDAAHRAHRAQRAAPPPAAETRGIPITAVSVSSAFHAARIVAGLAGYRAVSATIDPQWPLAHRVRIVLAAGIGLVISDDTALAEALDAEAWTGTILTLAEFRARERSARPAAAPTVRDGDEAFLLLFSSGTTSDPKAFLKTRRQYRENVAVSSAHLEPLPGVQTLAPGPLSYSLTLYALIESLATGGGAHLADVFDPVRIAQRIAGERITRAVAVPAVVQALTDAARRDPARFAGLELVVTGGANLPAAIRAGLAHALPRVRLISYYGAAEIGFIGDSRGGDGTLLDVYDGIGAEIRDDAGRTVPDGVLGTLWIRADACSDGYLAATTDAVLRGSDGWATVHDVARLIDGRLQLAGRAGDIVATGGHKVSLPEVERAFDGLPGIGAVCAVALPDPRLGSVVALVFEGPMGGRTEASHLHSPRRRTHAREESSAGILLPNASSPPEPAAHAASALPTTASEPHSPGRRTPRSEEESAANLLPSASSPPEPAARTATSGAEPAEPGARPPISKAELLAWARERLAPQFVPRRWYRIDRLPRTAGGKIRRGETVDLVANGRAVRL